MHQHLILHASSTRYVIQVEISRDAKSQSLFHDMGSSSNTKLLMVLSSTLHSLQCLQRPKIIIVCDMHAYNPSMPFESFRILFTAGAVLIFIPLSSSCILSSKLSVLSFSSVQRNPNDTDCPILLTMNLASFTLPNCKKKSRSCFDLTASGKHPTKS